MQKQTASKAEAMEVALISSFSLMATPTKASPAWHGTPLNKPSTTSSLHSSIHNSHSTHHISTPGTPCAYQKRIRSSIDLSDEPNTQNKRIKPLLTSNLKSLKPRRSRRKKALEFDRVVCIPFPVLRSQKDDPSALLRPLPRRSDEVKKLVKIRIEKELEKLRAGCDGILDSAIASPKKRRI